MFTGLVEALGRVKAVTTTRSGKRLVVDVLWPVVEGESIAVNGVCLTAVASHRSIATFDVIPETLKRTNLGGVKRGGAVNLERSLKAGARLGGHFVQGHVDGTGRVAAVTRSKGAVTLKIGTDLTRLMVPKGCVAVDGVSLTLVEVESDYFTVALIPTTLKVTTLGKARAGALLNLEIDILGKYIEKLAGRRKDSVTRELLKKSGFLP